jgi:hypothetical protein
MSCEIPGVVRIERGLQASPACTAKWILERIADKHLRVKEVVYQRNGYATMILGPIRPAGMDCEIMFRVLVGLPFELCLVSVLTDDIVHHTLTPSKQPQVGEEKSGMAAIRRAVRRGSLAVRTVLLMLAGGGRINRDMARKIACMSIM